MLVLVACPEPPGPPPPPPPTTTTTVITTTTTTTVPTPQPGDYYRLSRAGTYVEGYRFCSDHSGMVEEVCVSLCPWACWRDPEYVATYCSWGCSDGRKPFFDVTKSELVSFSVEGLELHNAGIWWMPRLPEVNKRCEKSHPEHHPDFCKRSDVRKTDFPNGEKAPFRKWQDAHAFHKNKAYILREKAQTDPVRQICVYDSIKGWCQCRNKYGG